MPSGLSEPPRLSPFSSVSCSALTHSLHPTSTNRSSRLLRHPCAIRWAAHPVLSLFLGNSNFLLLPTHPPTLPLAVVRPLLLRNAISPVTLPRVLCLPSKPHAQGKSELLLELLIYVGKGAKICQFSCSLVADVSQQKLVSD